MKIIKLKIITPERVVLESEVQQITLPTQLGEITVLPNHIPLLSVVVAGMIEVKQKGEMLQMATSGGFLEFHDNQVTILADTAERADEIDLERAQEARKQAEEMRKDKRMHLDENQYASVVSNLEKQLARVRVAKKYRPKGASHMGVFKS